MFQDVLPKPRTQVQLIFKKSWLQILQCFTGFSVGRLELHFNLKALLAQFFEFLAWQSHRLHLHHLPAPSVVMQGNRWHGTLSWSYTAANAVEFLTLYPRLAVPRPMKPLRHLDFIFFETLWTASKFLFRQPGNKGNHPQLQVHRPGDGVPWEWVAVIPCVKDCGHNNSSCVFDFWRFSCIVKGWLLICTLAQTHMHVAGPHYMGEVFGQQVAQIAAQGGLAWWTGSGVFSSHHSCNHDFGLLTVQHLRPPVLWSSALLCHSCFVTCCLVWGV